jgi:RNA polymerase sigma-70 factor (ECF subfamily)
MAAPVPVTFTDPAWLEEERLCLVALRRGDRKAFDRLYAVMAPPLYARVLLPRLGDPAAAEDVLSESFARLVEKLDTYEDRGASIWSWLVTIAANRAQDVHRERARGGRALVGYESLLAPLLEARGASDEEALDGPKLRAGVQRTLVALPPRYRRAIELRFFEERERAACAEILEVKLGTFDVLLLRALRAFRAAWLDSKVGHE